LEIIKKELKSKQDR